MWFFYTHATELRIYSKRLRTSVKRIKSQRSSGRVFFWCAVHNLYSCGPRVTCSLGSCFKEHHLTLRVVPLQEFCINRTKP
ncbi:hypothetical protein R3W88_031738 [Solanum pinnatisectum]|uniref:Uncharacterized protein n=1 Tax=Solanum pinnatisectum TaxID=50273 RepID=A0AAV9LM88_9SOLN|nr:hypothetical protein R3W88_031738 [Solanum pinnatisectum]